MTLLSREDPSRLLPIEGNLAIKIQEALKVLGYLDSVEDAFTHKADEALREWINTNNFENKMRDDRTIWQSVLDCMLDEAGKSQ